MLLHTKNDFTTLFESIVAPLKDKYSKKNAFLDVGTQRACYEDNVARMEAFSRILWGLVPYWMGGNTDSDFERIYKNGLGAGTNPESDEYWGACHDFDQRFVEMAAISYAMIFTPEKVWEPLSEKEKDNLSNWLYSINDLFVPESNWLFFRILVNVALKKCGRKYCQEKIENDFRKIDDTYLGDGWYSDGKISETIKQNGQRDYYISFAIHFYSLVYLREMRDTDTERCNLIRERATLFAKEFIYWFSDTGAAVPYGRSLTYRFAEVAFWSACVFADVYPYEIGVIKGIIARHLDYWLSDGRIFDNGHVLTVGYKYNQQIMCEAYNSAGSPYWALKAFAFLALPDSHEFWQVKALPMPALKQKSLQAKADLIAARYDGQATLYPIGTLDTFTGSGTMHKYLKFAYSTRFGFSVSKHDWSFVEAAPDSTLAFEIDDRIYTKTKCYSSSIDENSVKNEWSPCRWIRVKSEIIPTEKGHIRRHTVESEIECIAYDSGYAVSNLANEDLKTETADGELTVSNNFSLCTVKTKTGECKFFHTSPNTNLLSPKTVIPTAVYKISKGITEIETEIIEI